MSTIRADASTGGRLDTGALLPAWSPPSGRSSFGSRELARRIGSAHRGGGLLRGTWVFAAIFLLLAGGCSTADSESAPEGSLLVLAAASLNRAMPELIAAFEVRTGTPVSLVLGSTGNLTAQIEHGAPADLFFAADEVAIERLSRRGALRPGSSRLYAMGELVLVWREGVEAPSMEVLDDPRFGVIALASPAHAPYGVAAREVLEHLDLWEKLEPRIVQGENIAQAYHFVRTGNADLGLVARSIVEPDRPRRSIDPALHAPLGHTAAILSESRHPAASDFLDFVLSEEGQRILSKNGFGTSPQP